MFERRNLLLDIRSILGPRFFQSYVMQWWTCGSDADLVTWTKDLVNAQQLHFPFYPLVHIGPKRQKTTEEHVAEYVQGTDYPALPI